MNDLRKATASLLAVSDSDEMCACPQPQVTMSLSALNNLLYQIATGNGYEGTQGEFADAFVEALNGGHAVIESAPSKNDFPDVGEDGALYLDTSTGKIYYYEDGEYKQANADTEVTEEKLKDMVNEILTNDPEATEKIIGDATKDYLDENKNVASEAINDYLDEHPEKIVDTVADYLPEHGDKIIEGTKEFLTENFSDDIDDIVSKTLEENPDILTNGIQDYVTNNPEKLDESVDKYLDENKDEVKEIIDDYIKDNINDFIADHFEVEVPEDESKTDEEIINDKITGPHKNDIFVIKRTISDDVYVYTSYVYDGEKWCVMNGNVSADNVYFADDFVVTEPIGTVQDFVGKTVLPAKGLNLTQLLQNLFAVEKAPKIEMPSVTISQSTAKSYEVGTRIKPAWTAKFSNGSYEFDETTGIENLGWTITNSVNSETANKASGKFSEIEVVDDMNLTITASARYSEGLVPNSNLDKPMPEMKIAAGKAVKTSSALKGYRKVFYGGVIDKIKLNSDEIRDLDSTASAVKQGSSFSVNVTEGCSQIVVAIPAFLGDIDAIRKIKGGDELADFTVSSVMVEGANGYEAIEYKVYIKTYDEPTEEEAIYNVII